MKLADKRSIYRGIKRLRAVRSWQLVVILLLVAFIAATFLRMNSTGMVARRNAVLAADKSGNVEDITSRIFDLQRYAAAHMNADTGVFYLQETYNRDVRKTVQAETGASSGDASPQAKADAICNPQLGVHGYSKAYQDCMMAELNKAGQVVDPSSIKLPSPSLYRYSFISPLWSPDFAGWSVLVCVVLALVIVLRLVSLLVLKLLLRRHYHRL